MLLCVTCSITLAFVQHTVGLCNQDWAANIKLKIEAVSTAETKCSDFETRPRCY